MMGYYGSGMMGYYGIYRSYEWQFGRPNCGCCGHTFKGWWLMLFLMMFLYISMVVSSNIIILSGMGHTSQFWVLWSHF